jgi:hypothetical protein
MLAGIPIGLFSLIAASLYLLLRFGRVNSGYRTANKLLRTLGFVFFKNEEYEPDPLRVIER